MKCPYCSNLETKVTDKRDSETGDITRRRRECLKCKKRFTTFERVETINLVVVKKDGKRERFDREKIFLGMLKACEKRPISKDAIDSAVNDIEQKLKSLKTTEIPSRFIGELVMRKLKKLDKVAYIRFASVYRSFTDLESFEEELKRLIKK
ncbi:MAG: transcriptional repressor NrdR [Nanoarchaeota archaeon]|nr:MAG: transcriptional repressor NrdR [Nanoarchaeota archaeon]